MLSFCNMLFKPWFATDLSRPLCTVLRNIGHRMKFVRGEVLYESQGLFQRLMLIETGIVARALMEPFHEAPLLLSVSGPGALCGAYETLYVQDGMIRRHWCMTSASIVVVNAELLLRLCDQNADWQRELEQYRSMCAIGDRLGRLVNRSTSPEERLGIFLVVSSLSLRPDFEKLLRNPGIEWLPLGGLPSAKVLAGLLELSVGQVRLVCREWWKRDVMRYRSHKVLLSRRTFLEYWKKAEPLWNATANSSSKYPFMPMRDSVFPDALF